METKKLLVEYKKLQLEYSLDDVVFYSLNNKDLLESADYFNKMEKKKVTYFKKRKYKNKSREFEQKLTALNHKITFYQARLDMLELYEYWTGLWGAFFAIESRQKKYPELYLKYLETEELPKHEKEYYLNLESLDNLDYKTSERLKIISNNLNSIKGLNHENEILQKASVKRDIPMYYNQFVINLDEENEVYKNRNLSCHFHVIIDEKGNLVFSCLYKSSGYEHLDELGFKKLETVQFTPGLDKNRNPIETLTDIGFTFK